MPETGIQSILQILAGQHQPVDPRATALLDVVKSGAMPGNQVITSLNTALDLLSPSASRDVQDQFSGIPELENLLGLSREEAQQLVRQQTGLAVSPGQQLQHEGTMLGMMPDFMNAQANVSEAESRSREADFKGEELGVKQGELKVKQAEEERLREAFNRGTPQERDQMFNEIMKRMVLTGMDAQGNPVDKTMQRNAFRLLTLGRERPELTQLVRGLVEEGDFDTAGQLVGLDPGTLKNSFRFLGLGRMSSKAGDNDLSAAGSGPEETSTMKQQRATESIDASVDSYWQALQQLMELAAEGGMEDVGGSFDGRQSGFGQNLR